MDRASYDKNIEKATFREFRHYVHKQRLEIH